MSHTSPAIEAPETWLSQRERGSLWLIRLTSGFCHLVGRRATRWLSQFIALYYTLFDTRAVQASRTWLSQVQQRPASRRQVYQHLRHFVQVTIDRFFLLRGEQKDIHFERTGNHHLLELAHAKRGAILLGAHLGSFEAMRAASGQERLPLYIVGHFENAAMINAVLEKLDPEMAGRVIHIGSQPVALALQLKERVENGDLLAILGDRVGLNDKSITVDFMDKPARFPTGPFLLASALKCPVYLVFGLYEEPNQYRLFCEPLVEKVDLPRKTRQQALQRLVQAYADRLEYFARMAPNNWFNFFDFWEEAK